MARPQCDREATIEQLLEAAEELIRQRGPFNMTTADVANACGMSQSNVYRFFPSKDALYEAIAERWFREINETMEAVIESDLPPREKMVAFFERRLAIKLARYEDDPALFRSYLTLGEQHHEVVHSYIDLATHYLSVIVGEAMADGAFAGCRIDDTVVLVSLMTMPFCDPHIIIEHPAGVTTDNLRRVIDVIFAGMGTGRETALPAFRLAS